MVLVTFGVMIFVDMNILNDKKVRIALRVVLWIFAIIFIVAMTCDYAVSRVGIDKTYDNIQDVPARKVGLLLGTNPKDGEGNANPYYTTRIEAAVNLYEAGKIERILVSGNNDRKGYDEPLAMKNDLMAAGVPDSAIYIDNDGFRTYDSIVSAKYVFGQNKILIISQKFHNERALFLAKNCGIDAIAFNAADCQNKIWQIRMRMCEYGSRILAAYDVLAGEKPFANGEKGVIK